jgi:hypothetical protein
MGSEAAARAANDAVHCRRRLHRIAMRTLRPYCIAARFRKTTGVESGAAICAPDAAHG